MTAYVVGVKAAARVAELSAITVITDPEELGALNKTLLRSQLDVRRERLKEPVIAGTKLKEMKNKPQMLKAILASDERYLFLLLLRQTTEPLQVVGWVPEPPRMA